MPVWQIVFDVPASTISMPLEVIVAPGTVAVITVPPIDPEFGEIETNFDFSTDYSPIVEYAGIAADSVTVDSATSTSATFTLGVPISSSGAP